uniref:EH domain-containing protein n=1 Tax=Mesocestoides corti TaxID=53468 RepID=A0A5K3FZT1_MESCO
MRVATVHFGLRSVSPSRSVAAVVGSTAAIPALPSTSTVWRAHLATLLSLHRSGLFITLLYWLPFISRNFGIHNFEQIETLFDNPSGSKKFVQVLWMLIVVVTQQSTTITES